MKLNRGKLRRMILAEIKRSLYEDNILQQTVDNFFDTVDQELGGGKMSPRTLRTKLRIPPISIRSGYTAYAMHKPSGKKGILVFGLDEEDLTKKNSLTNIKSLNQHHKPKGEKGIKSIAMYPNSEAKNFELIGGSAAIKSIKDDEPFTNDAKFSFQDYLSKDLEGEVFLYTLE
jgi:hypothetical protein